MAPARFVLRHTGAALCAFAFLAASLTLPAQDAQPPAPAAPAAEPAPAAPAQPAGTPQLNDDGTSKLDAAGNVVTEPAPPPPPPPCKPSKGISARR